LNIHIEKEHFGGFKAAFIDQIEYF